MNFLKINEGESQIVTLTEKEVKEEKNQWGGWTYNHIVNLNGNLFTFSATEKAQEQLVNFKSGDVVKISKISLETGGTKYIIEKVESTEVLTSLKNNILGKDRDYKKENTGKCLNTLLCATISSGIEVTESVFDKLLNLAKSNMELKWIEHDPIELPE